MADNFPAGWKLLPLEDCMAALIDYRGVTPKKSSIGVPLVTAKIVKGGRLLDVNEYIPTEDYDDWMRRGLPETGDVLMTTEAPLGEIAQLVDRKVALAQRLITLRGKPELLDNTFLKFLMMSDFVQHQLKAHSTGTTVLGIKQSELRKINLVLPPLNEQCTIAEVLGSLDDKIELNRHMNTTLESMSSALFKAWFINNPGAKGWEVVKFSEIAEISREATMPTNFPKEVFNHYSIPAYDDIRFPLQEFGEQIKSNKFRVVDNCVLLSKLNPNIKRIWLPFKLNGRSICSTEFLVCVPTARISQEYLFSFLSTQTFLDKFVSMVTGTSGSHQRVKAEYVLDLTFPIPTKSTVISFTNIVKPLLDKNRLNILESRTLSSLRDSLLPHLMRGELRIRDVEKNL